MQNRECGVAAERAGSRSRGGGKREFIRLGGESWSVPYYSNLAARLNFTLPPSTFKQMEQKYAKDFSGDAMYKKIIADAEDQLHRLSCFVAGTLVHTKEGLRPIEQIKVGDYVLSKPEDGSGEPSYKRVTKTFESGEKEVWFVGYIDPDDNHSEQFIVATADHPFFVKELDNRSWAHVDDPVVSTYNLWKSAAEMFRHYLDGNGIVFELADGRKRVCSTVGPLLGAINESGTIDDVGVVYSHGVAEGNEGTAIDFSKGVPDYFGYEPWGDRMLTKSLFAKLDEWSTKEQMKQLRADAIVNITNGYAPLLRKVYNLEVEDNHTYYVGKHGVLVHNTCKVDLDPLHTINPNVSPAQPLRVYLDSKRTELIAAFKDAGDRGLAIINDINLKGAGSWFQAKFDGAVFNGIRGEADNLLAYALGYVNSINRTLAGTVGNNFISIGDALAHIYQSGKRIATSIFVDTKAGSFGYDSTLMQRYVNGEVLADNEMKKIGGIVMSLQQRSLALEQYNNLGLVYVPQKNFPYAASYQDNVSGQQIPIQMDGGIELFTKFLNKVIGDPKYQTVPSGMMSVPGGINWSFADWFSPKVMIADSKLIVVDGMELRTVADKITVFEKTFEDILDANGAVIGKRVSGIVAKEVDASTILKPADQTAQADAIKTLKDKLTELGKSNLLVNEVGGNNLGNNTLTQTDLAKLLPIAKQYWLAAGASAAVLDATQITIADLPAGVAGQTQGIQVTLSADGAGWGWFVDATPTLSEEFTLQANTTWQANPDAAANGKLDLLTVLIHELGHRLGLEHGSAGAMEGIVQAGERQLPTAEEVAVMQNIHDAITAKPHTTSTTQTLVTQYAVAANATFANLATPAGWNSQGSVDIASGAATLNEISTSQTRLSQVFMLNEQDRYLSFTLSGTALDDLNGAPDDAFEVALLDANTGANLLGGIGLSHSDAFLNIQGDGTRHMADCVTCTDNPDGSRTYRVDLTGVAKNTAVNLSFDLLGFGQDNSHVTLSDIRVSGLPQLIDEAATLAEDNLLTFDPFAQADAALRPLLASQIVASPTHGVLAINADGTFAYTPDLDYFGTDSFSYRLSDGPLDSNLATVSLTVTAVNDAPAAADVALATAEDAALVITLYVYATDVDSFSIGARRAVPLL